MTMYAMAGGSWREIPRPPLILTGGAWRQVNQGFVLTGGVWKPIWLTPLLDVPLFTAQAYVDREAGGYLNLRTGLCTLYVEQLRRTNHHYFNDLIGGENWQVPGRGGPIPFPIYGATNAQQHTFHALALPDITRYTYINVRFTSESRTTHVRIAEQPGPWNDYTMKWTYDDWDGRHPDVNYVTTWMWITAT